MSLTDDQVIVVKLYVVVYQKKKKLKVFHMTDTVPKPSGVLAAKSCWHRKLFGIFMHLQWDNCYMSGGPVNMSKS